jgi:hypothetical protein
MLPQMIATIFWELTKDILKKTLISKKETFGKMSPLVTQIFEASITLISKPNKDATKKKETNYLNL